MRPTSIAIPFLITCTTIYKATAICESEDQDGLCSNVFRKGCLREIAARRRRSLRLDRPNGEDLKTDNITFDVRVCNSDDLAIAAENRSDHCRDATFDYTEIRFAPGDWDSAVFVSWIQQIILSEVLGVPVTIESGPGNNDDELSFYHFKNKYELPNQLYPMELLVEADRVLDGNCSDTETPCAHVIPEIWRTSDADILDAIEEGKILPYKPNGILGGFSFYIPLFTAEKDLSLTSFRGLKGEENREKLANTFKDPTNWTDFCNYIDPNNCTVTSSNWTTAARYPKNEEEKSSYFVPDLYNGYFRTTDANNCTENPGCKGHIVNPKCDWTAYLDNQLYWNDIHLESRGYLEPNNGYSFSHIVQIIKAANATKSGVFFWWWTPEMTVEEFEGTSAELQRVHFPKTSIECLQNRAEKLHPHRCYENITDRQGDVLASCDYPVITVKKLMSNGLATASKSDYEALVSPAYAFIDEFFLPDYGLHSLLRKWLKSKEESIDGDPREAVCEWVYDNLDELLQNAPRGYPREKQYRNFAELSIAGWVLGSVAMLATAFVAFLTYKWKESNILKMAQLNVLGCMVCGYALLSISAISSAIGTTNISCIIHQWTQRLGYSLVLVPILIKISTINTLGRRYRRAKVSAFELKRPVLIVITGLVTYLILWTGIDSPSIRDDAYTIDEDFGSKVVTVHRACASKSIYWEMVVSGFEAMILFSTTILSYQSRELIHQLDESRCLTTLVYTHSAFKVVRLTMYTFAITNTIGQDLFVKVNSLLLALETICAVFLYFTPQFKKIFRVDQTRLERSLYVFNKASGSRGKVYVSGFKMPVGAGGVPKLTDKSKRDSSCKRCGKPTSVPSASDLNK